MKKGIKIGIAAALTAVALSTAAVGVHLGYAKTTAETADYTAGEAPLRVAIISDLQLPNSNSKETHQYKSFEETLTMLKNKGMDALIIAGDFTDLSTKSAWGSFKEIYDRVLGENKPIPLFIMGNHDYWLPAFNEIWEVAAPAKLQKRFTKYTGEYPFGHKIINGYHFICMSSSDGTYDKSYSDSAWVKAELDKAVADAPDRPVFVITHLNPSDTVYGSDEWGNSDIHDILKDYSQAVSISGHSHYSLIDERSIWQGEYTAFSTQSLDYIELESGKFNGSIPKDAYGKSLAKTTPACLYMTVESDKVTVERLEAHTGKALKEPWVIEAPFSSPQKYTEKRAEKNSAPAMPAELDAKITKITDIHGVEQKMLSFNAGTDDDFVHSYALEFLDKDGKLLEFEETDYENSIVRYDENGAKLRADNKNYESGKSRLVSRVLYFSDFALGLENMSKTAELRLPHNLPAEAVKVRIRAVDSWGKESESAECELIYND